MAPGGWLQQAQMKGSADGFYGVWQMERCNPGTEPADFVVGGGRLLEPRRAAFTPWLENRVFIEDHYYACNAIIWCPGNSLF